MGRQSKKRVFIVGFSLSLLFLQIVNQQRAEACSIRHCGSPYLGAEMEGTISIPPNLKAINLGPFYSSTHDLFQGKSIENQGVQFLDDRGAEREIQGKFPAPRLVDRTNGRAVDYELRELSRVGGFGTELEIVFSTPLQPSRNYELRGVPRQTCMGARGEELTEVQTLKLRTQARPLPGLPGTLGKLSVGEPEYGELTVAAPASCSRKMELHYVDISLDEEEVGPWAPYLYYRTEYIFAESAEVEDDEIRFKEWKGERSMGEAIPYGTSWQGRGIDRFYRQCRGMAEDKKNWVLFRMVAAVPGESTVLYSDIAAVELPCPRVEEEVIEVEEEQEEIFVEELEEVETRIESSESEGFENGPTGSLRFDWDQVEQAQAEIEGPGARAIKRMGLFAFLLAMMGLIGALLWGKRRMD